MTKFMYKVGYFKKVNNVSKEVVSMFDDKEDAESFKNYIADTTNYLVYLNKWTWKTEIEN